MKIRSIGIIGYGEFGVFVSDLVGRFAPEVEVKVFSRGHEPDGKQFFSEAEVCSTDAVVLCCPIHEYESTLTRILPLIPKASIIVDVATVKKYTSDLLQKLAGERLYLCTHPMFGPESYKKTGGEVTGYRIVLTNSTIPKKDMNELKGKLEGLGFVMPEMSVDEHDRLLADTLFLTHYIGQTMKQAGFLRTDIDTVSFQSLMNAVESVAHDEQLFADVYRFNPYCRRAAERFHKAQKKVLESLPE